MARHHDRQLQARRDREFQATSNAGELAELERKWAREDSAAEAAASWRAQEVLELRRRVAALERALGTGGKAIVDALIGPVADALKGIREEERQHTAEAIRKAFEDRCLLDYKGVWQSDAGYARGSCVTDKGALWIATGPCERGQRPGSGVGWRLAVKIGAET